ncbi:ChrR family anti-sigma-E factor [Vibrio sp. SS-MA-C1-2]|uniref:ChrR family anti-sigma-E factor n=1 Tax=Vibrio sp. SS-MA-C1-2 TaxID=2908646 RepID=UPI001F2848CF|nr:ChrR family anti-sigma-E factor [Vibrio sp. SS-MA-C1-2]UJF18366.1 ChrR family anti-sigma-E factor [Vibrio sp. SS-MA-C1-2]
MALIKHHPTFELLTLFVQGELDESLAIAVSAHCELCEQCNEQVTLLTQQEAHQAFFTEDDISLTSTNALDVNFDILLDDIFSSEQKPTILSPQEPKEIKVQGKYFSLPKALNNYDIQEWKQIAGVSRASLNQNNLLRSNLLYIEANKAIPEHTHQGFELTLLLSGSFRDQCGEYQAGDFIWLDEKCSHSPKTTEGCLCYTVQNAPISFTQGVNRLINPFTTMLY